MIERVKARDASHLPRAAVTDGIALCPECGRPLCEPLGGSGQIAVWCRRCRRHILIKFSFYSKSLEPTLPN